MPLEVIAGRGYGPVEGRLAAEKVAELVAATGDDPARWAGVAPPSYAGALLFAVAPLLLADPDVEPSTRVLVHSDQRFAWHRPLLVDTPVSVSGEVTRVRRRGPIAFVTLECGVVDDEGPLVASTSTFLMGDQPAADPGPDPGEPPVDAGPPHPTTPRIDGLAAGRRLPAVEYGASRLDLVRYAAASGDFNPIHFDHESARTAGLSGVVVHGLLMAAWLARLAAAATRRPDPLAEMGLRFRNPLRPGDTAVATGTAERVGDDSAELALALRGTAGDLVTADAVIRIG